METHIHDPKLVTGKVLMLLFFVQRNINALFPGGTCVSNVNAVLNTETMLVEAPTFVCMYVYPSVSQHNIF